MPEDGVELTPSKDILSTVEIIRLAKLFVSQGINKVRLTGGEPLLRKDLQEIVSKYTGISLRVNFNTNINPLLKEVCRQLPVYNRLP